jgi:hypothetical protein
MTVPLRVSIGIWLGLICLASSLMAWRWFDSAFRSSMTIAAQHKSMQRAPVTVASVAALPADPNRPGSRLRVCFSIDSFDGIAAADRSYYETHERARQAANGPLCIDEPASAEAPRPGTRLMLSFTLENGGIIAPYELTTDGQALQP